MNNCGPCPAGTRVSRNCNATISRTCETCPEGTFSDKETTKPYCQRCKRCRRKELVENACTKTANTLCVCRPGYIYRDTKPCYKCPEGLQVRNNKCANTTINVAPTIQTKDSNNLVIGFACGFSILVLLVVFFVLVRLWYRRRGIHRVPHEDTPDVLKQVVQTNKTPPLPPKMSRRRNENMYGPEPEQTRPLVEKKIISRQLPFSLVHDMNIKLSSAHQKNYKHLAGELGYSFAFVKSLETKSQPLETLIDDYMCSPNPTKERLYEALVNIGRTDVAQMVWDEL